MMGKRILFLLSGLIFLCLLVNGRSNFTLANSKATPASRQVLKIIYKIREEGKFLTCQHVRERTVNILDKKSEYQHVYDVTGKYPAILGVDFYQDPSAAVTSAIRQWKRGGLVTITWHQSSPMMGFQGGWNTVSSKMAVEDFKQLITPGTSLNTTWIEHIDKIAGYLKTLRDSGVVVLWRPYHEMNGNWFWWCDKGEDFRKLWISMFDRYTRFHHLNNLIWVFGPNIGCKDPAIFYPGSEYVDIGGFDIYNNVRKIDVSEHDKIKKVLDGKPVAMTETGLLPMVEDFIGKTEYVWFMPWHTAWCDNTFFGMPGANGPGNNAGILKEYYSNPDAVSLENLSKYLKHRKRK